jgi:hypothetical protein
MNEEDCIFDKELIKSDVGVITCIIPISLEAKISQQIRDHNRKKKKSKFMYKPAITRKSSYNSHQEILKNKI